MFLKYLSPLQWIAAGVVAGLVMILAYRYLSAPLAVNVPEGVTGLYHVLEKSHYEGWFFDRITLWIDPVHTPVFKHQKYFLRRVYIDFTPEVRYVPAGEQIDICTALFSRIL
jgi:hypothetical protein